MISSPADIVRYFLVQGGYGRLPSVTTPGLLPIYTDDLPDDPDELIAVSNTAGVKDGRYMRTGETVVHPGIQVLTRALMDPIAWQYIRVLEKAFDPEKKQSVTIVGLGNISDIYVLEAVSRRPAIKIVDQRGMDEKYKRRFLYAINATITITNTGRDPY